MLIYANKYPAANVPLTMVIDATRLQNALLMYANYVYWHKMHRKCLLMYATSCMLIYANKYVGLHQQ